MLPLCLELTGKVIVDPGEIVNKFLRKIVKKILHTLMYVNVSLSQPDMMTNCLVIHSVLNKLLIY